MQLAVGRPQVQRVIEEFRTASQRHPLDGLRQHPEVAPEGAGILDEEEEHLGGPGSEPIRTA
ncbi:hypothetical protein ABZX90_39825 [Streptomyces sp. NPDC002935]|uniref:hypothetical protein n=1 Tax=Streptomyces sp. NPDC002935 TaxID=3154545 RepID=UPI0033BF6D03